MNSQKNTNSGINEKRFKSKFKVTHVGHHLLADHYSFVVSRNISFRSFQIISQRKLRKKDEN